MRVRARAIRANAHGHPLRIERRVAATALPRAGVRATSNTDRHIGHVVRLDGREAQHDANARHADSSRGRTVRSVWWLWRQDWHDANAGSRWHSHARSRCWHAVWCQPLRRQAAWHTRHGLPSGYHCVRHADGRCYWCADETVLHRQQPFLIVLTPRTTIAFGAGTTLGSKVSTGSKRQSR